MQIIGLSNLHDVKWNCCPPAYWENTASVNQSCSKLLLESCKQILQPYKSMNCACGTEGELNLSGKVHDCVDVVLSKKMANQVCALNISFHQLRSTAVFLCSHWRYIER